MRNTFIQTLVSASVINENIYIVSGDAGFGVFETFREKWPERFLNTGVAEASMIGYSAGMAMAGFDVFVYNIIPFLLYRCYEQVRNDICYQKLPVTLIGIGAGLSYAPSGMTHYSVEDIALARTMPNLKVISPIDPVETKAAVLYALNSNEPVYIRIAKSGEPAFRNYNESIDITEPAVIKDGEEIVILSHGTIFKEAAEAAVLLNEKNIHPRLISVPMLSPFNEEKLVELIKGFKHIIVIEEHYRTGALASITSELLLKYKINVKFTPLTLPDKFIHDIHDQKGMRLRYNLNAQAIFDSAKPL